jgi:glycosyltransferase involved in cell wall biosynthesis
MSLKEFAETYSDNDQTRLLAGKYGASSSGTCSDDELLNIARRNLSKYFAVVGIMEEFDRSLILMKRILGWRNPFYMRRNVTRGRPRKDELPQETLDVIQANNELDLELYRYAEKLFQEQIGSQSPSFENELQRFRKLNGIYGRLHVLLSVGRKITAAKIPAAARLFIGMSNQPLVSVVIIFFNAERFIQEAIDSVFAQTYKNWELLLVDDGSGDASTAIARSYLERHPRRVRYLEHSGHANRGMSASRNLGIRNAQGSYVAFLDADDVWLSNILEEQVGILEAYPEAVMAYGPIEYWYSWTGNPEDRERDYLEKLGVRANTVIQPPRLLPLFLRDKAAVPSGILVRRKTIDQVGGFEDAFPGEYEDQVFCAKICLSAPVFASGRRWYRYRQHPDSCVLTSQRTGETDSARLRFLNWLDTYLEAQNTWDRSVWRALEFELWRYRYPRAFRLLRRGDRLVNQINGFFAQHGGIKWNSPRL